jgi:hypothetical protein
MTERDVFESRLHAALLRHVANGPTDFDALGFARVVAAKEPRRLGFAAALTWRGVAIPRAAWALLLLAGLLAALVGGMLFVGSQSERKLPAVVPPVGPTTTPPTTYATVSAGTYTAVSVGGDHTCAIRTGGTLECWGHNYFGQATPPEGTFVAVSAGMNHTCAIRTDGTLTCWGWDLSDQATPPDGGTYVAVSAGSHHTCAIRTDGTIACWGRSAGVAAVPSGTFSAVTAGQEHTCAIRTDGTLACWGFDDGRRVSPPAGTYVSVDDFDECAIRTNGTLTCWASGGVSAPPHGTYVAVAGGWGATCAIRRDGMLTCWGPDAGPAPPAGIYTALSNSLPDYEACAIRMDGRLTCWGDDWIAKTDMGGNWTGPPTTLLPDMRGILPASDVPEIDRGTVKFGTGGSGCGVTAPSKTFSVSDTIRFAANLEREVRADEVVTIRLWVDGQLVDGDVPGEAASRTFDVPGTCIGGVLHWAYAAPPWSHLLAFPISLTTGHYRVTFLAGGVLSQGEFDVGP